jgi:hypothetical protein
MTGAALSVSGHCPTNSDTPPGRNVHAYWVPINLAFLVIRPTANDPNAKPQYRTDSAVGNSTQQPQFDFKSPSLCHWSLIGGFL